MSIEQKAEAVVTALVELMEEVAGNGEEEKPAPAKRGRKPAGGKKAAPVKKTAPKRGRGKKSGPTEQDCRNALRRVSKELEDGKEIADEILAEFEVDSVPDLDEGDYADFIKACEDELEEED